jgi:glycosyltransferase involved in cell wall biosynthesis
MSESQNTTAGEKILLISQVFYPDEVAVANLFTDLSVALVRLGAEIDVWCAQPSYTSTERQPRHIEYKNVRIHHLLSTNFHKSNFAGRVINFLSFSLSVLVKLLFSRSKVRVLSHTTPPFLAILIAIVCSIRGRKFYYVIMDVFPDGLIRLKKFSERNIFITLWHSLHLYAMKKSTAIVVIGRDMKDWIGQVYPEGSGKTRYIPLWQNEELIQPIDFKDNPFVSGSGLLDRFVVQYSGNMGLWNKMETIGQAINLNPDNVVFMIIGDGMRKKELLNSIKEVNNSNVLFYPFQPNEDYAYSVSACHAALVSLREGLEGMAVPSKIIGILASGIPVIALVPENSEIAYIVSEEKCGYVIDPSDSDGLVRAINELKSDDELRMRLGQNGRDAFLRKYTTSIIAERYLSLLKNL